MVNFKESNRPVQLPLVELDLVWDLSGTLGRLALDRFPIWSTAAFSLVFCFIFHFHFELIAICAEYFFKMDTIKFEKKSSETFKNPGQPAVLVSASDQDSR